MFTTDFFIDNVQNAKKIFVETYVKNESFKKELVKLIDAQTSFAKGSIASSLSVAQIYWKSLSDIAYPKKTA
jgi:hypothetical protein